MTFGLFEAYGLELEYMVVDRASFAVRPIVDELLKHFAGSYAGDFADGPITWSNELALHVLELKHTAPVPTLRGAAATFQRSLLRLDAALAPMGALLLPGGMHPTMDPQREFRRWPHEYGEVYGAYDRIFDCRGHGWANVQSCHLNLSFADDEQFGRLHLAARALLPLLPALAASSPYCEGRFTGWLDWRLQAYRGNQARVPRIAGLVVPEPVTTRADYYAQILEPMWSDLAPFDPDKLLREEWVNSRGAVAKFFRDALEIRILDAQECAAADVAVCTLVVAALRALCSERWCDRAMLAALDTKELADVLWSVAKHGDQAVVAHRGLLAALGLDGASGGARSAIDVWRHLADATLRAAEPLDPEVERALRTILAHGPLARRLLAAFGTSPNRTALRSLCAQLADCVRNGVSFA